MRIETDDDILFLLRALAVAELYPVYDETFEELVEPLLVEIHRLLEPHMQVECQSDALRHKRAIMRATQGLPPQSSL
jgi:hypothetical protein